MALSRRLAAILAADIVGYSRLISADEAGTLARLKAIRKELIDPKIAEFRGRVVKTTGDGILIEFKSVVDAVSYAADVQGTMAQRNGAQRAEDRIEFRVGINLGEIVVDGRDIHGDGVNVAARLEALSPPGAICISGRVHEEIVGKVSLAFHDLGEQALKNIPRPVRVYQIGFDAEGTQVAPPERESGKLALPDKPSIAILPFVNMSGDAEQEYFADGITEDLCTALSRIRWLFVIARNSTFVYKGRAIDVKQVARDLGVRYVLEGSVRKSGNRVRVTAQLIDVASGAHHWAERYDRELTDIFALQDEITQHVASAIEPSLLAAEGLRSQSQKAADLDAWGLVIRATARFWRMTRADSGAALAMLEEAVARFPEYAPAHSMLAFIHVVSGYIGWTPMFEVPQRLIESARRAAELDDRDPWASVALGYIAFVQRLTDRAVAEYSRAIDLNPNFAAAYGLLGLALALDGQSEAALPHLQRAMRISPNDPLNTIFSMGIGIAHYLAGRYVDAVEWCRRSVQLRPDWLGGQRVLAASLAQAGRLDEARATLARVRQLQPDLSIKWLERMLPYTAAQMPHFLEGMRKAGLTN